MLAATSISNMLDMAEDMTTAAAIMAAGLGVAKPIVETGCTLLENLLGQPAKVAGGMLADSLYAWRWENRVKVAHRAKQIMERDGVAARVVPKGFLLPLVEAAGNVEDPDLQEMWAQLLASGVADDENQHPMFVDTLRRLNRSDALYLKKLIDRSQSHAYRSAMTTIMGPATGSAGARRNFPYSARPDKEVARLQSIGVLAPVLVANKPPLGPDTTGMNISARGTEISAYGWQFIRAVMPDPKKDGSREKGPE